MRLLLLEVLSQLDLLWSSLHALLGLRVAKVLLKGDLVGVSNGPVDELTMRVHLRILTLRLQQVIQIVFVHLIDSSSLRVLDDGGAGGKGKVGTGCRGENLRGLRAVLG